MQKRNKGHIIWLVIEGCSKAALENIYVGYVIPDFVEIIADKE